MKTINLSLDHLSYKPIKEVADSVLKGGVMIYPTDTIYGLGCDIFSKQATARISKIKKRSVNKPFSFVCENIGQISEFAFLSNWGYRLLKRTLPGPYTYILEARHANMPKKMLGNRNSVGVRIPDHPICHQLIKLIGRPIVTTSVNLADDQPLTDLSMLSKSFTQQVDIAIDIGPILSDPSTVIDLTGKEPKVIRKGKGDIPW
ncbi:Hypothetical YciO protein, TsaC/YrdC paralog [hydrothermal vent metagenome]|uniref:Hypothetical YciO protein, TsaC/YrdC paralog n=1 Tax=hydrothermal vent metagenome TaxID=652676 RepID=A0A3B1CMN2_9ZZZZ